MDVCRRLWLALLWLGLILPAAIIKDACAQDAASKVIDVRIENRQVVEPQEAIRVTEGEVIELRWTSDEAAELHLHGYDIELEVKPGEPASMVVEAYATGRFPIEIHGGGNEGHGEDTLTFLEVYPK